MYKNQEQKLKNQILDNGGKQSAYNSNVYRLNNTTIKFDSGNGFNAGGDIRRGYDTCKNYVTKKS